MTDASGRTASIPPLTMLTSPGWVDYELLDTGEGQKLERYGPYTFIRPEPQAVWRPALPDKDWQAAHAQFHPSQEESGGHWEFFKPIQPGWMMGYNGLKFRVQTTGGRHLGVFPEQAAQWDWLAEAVQATRRPVHILNLFGYTGLASLTAARAGGRVTHVDASKKSVAWARENQALSGLEDKPIRWIVDDALKFTQREVRRGSRYEGILLDPPKFGRGPKGEVWEFIKLLPELLDACRQVLSERPLFVCLTAYAIRLSALSLYYGLESSMAGFVGKVEAGELVLAERSAGRVISLAIYARWLAHKD